MPVQVCAGARVDGGAVRARREDQPRTGPRRVPVVALAAVTGLATVLAGFVARAATDAERVDAGACAVVASLSLRPELCDAPEPVPADEPEIDVYGPPVCRVYAQGQERGRSVRTERVDTLAGAVLLEESAGRTVRAVGTGAGVPDRVLGVGELPDGTTPRAAAPDDVVGAGEAWEFADRAAWEAFQAQVDTHTLQRGRLTSGSGPAHVWWLGATGSAVPSPDPATTTFVRVPLDLGLVVGLGAVPARGSGTTTTRSTPALLGAQHARVTVESDTATGAQHWTYELEGDGGDEPEIGSLALSRDQGGELTQVVVGAVTADGRSRLVTTTTLSVDDDSRGTADDWVARRTVEGGGSALALPVAVLNPATPSSRAFGDLLYRQATSSTITYRGVRDADAFATAITDGWGLGLAVRAQDAGAVVAEASYLGAPSRTGERIAVPETACTGGASF